MCEAIEQFREMINTGDFHDYDIIEVIRHVIDSISTIYQNPVNGIPNATPAYPYHQIQANNLGIPASYVEAINRAIRFLTDELHHMCMVHHLYTVVADKPDSTRHMQLTHTKFDYCEHTNRLTLLPSHSP